MQLVFNSTKKSRCILMVLCFLFTSLHLVLVFSLIDEQFNYTWCFLLSRLRKNVLIEKKDFLVALQKKKWRTCLREGTTEKNGMIFAFVLTVKKLVRMTLNANIAVSMNMQELLTKWMQTKVWMYINIYTSPIMIAH